MARASPKSAILSWRCRVIRRFCGFRSRCRICFWWQKATPRRSWNKKDYSHGQGELCMTTQGGHKKPAAAKGPAPGATDLDDHGLGLAPAAVEVFLQVVVAKLKDQRQLALAVEDVHQAASRGYAGRPAL
jgi:hypothetical protein